jgi:hypothetical protein
LLLVWLLLVWLLLVWLLLNMLIRSKGRGGCKHSPSRWIDMRMQVAAIAGIAVAIEGSCALRIMDMNLLLSALQQR